VSSISGKKISNAPYQEHEMRQIASGVNAAGAHWVTMSKGEGWENGYHVYSTARNGAKIIDAGKVGNFSVGQSVYTLYDRERGSGEIHSVRIDQLGRATYDIRYSPTYTTTAPASTIFTSRKAAEDAYKAKEEERRSRRRRLF